MGSYDLYEITETNNFRWICSKEESLFYSWIFKNIANCKIEYFHITILKILKHLKVIQTLIYKIMSLKKFKIIEIKQQNLFQFQKELKKNSYLKVKNQRQHIYGHKNKKINEQLIWKYIIITIFKRNTQILEKLLDYKCQEYSDGDIVLFKSKNNLTKVARAILMCDYDHVSLLYRDEGLLYCFEAVQSGVGTFPWTYMIEQCWVNDYEKIIKSRSVRQIKIVYNKQFWKQIQHLTQQNFLRLFHKLNPVKIQEIEEKKRTFFCSELVAKAYKEMGLLDPVKSCTQYYPKDFTSEKKLQLLDGATLDAELLVTFEL
ncbi:unnamed protein product [Paramecium sonneborni]|uniref:Uncharacterized protein n=1 Tax=Paramecium sonneborni TaxID=65129 RepID=A0A8S1NRM2_9CILI|nr:unnamed protein product [Paramecium sonneborni]